MHNKSNIRIISGKWRGRKINFITKNLLRPTLNRVRETLFNWLNPRILGSRCLDLYAGTGALGLEAMSRGAKLVIAVDNDIDHILSMNENAKYLQSYGFIAQHCDCLAWLKDNHGFIVDIIFIDPPYKKHLLKKTFDILEKNNWINTNCMIYFELDKPLDLAILPNTWIIYRHSKAGKVYYFLAKKHIE